MNSITVKWENRWDSGPTRKQEKTFETLDALREAIRALEDAPWQADDERAALVAEMGELIPGWTVDDIDEPLPDEPPFGSSALENTATITQPLEDRVLAKVMTAYRGINGKQMGDYLVERLVMTVSMILMTEIRRMGQVSTLTHLERVLNYCNVTPEDFLKDYLAKVRASFRGNTATTPVLDYASRVIADSARRDEQLYAHGIRMLTHVVMPEAIKNADPVADRHKPVPPMEEVPLWRVYMPREGNETCAFKFNIPRKDMIPGVSFQWPSRSPRLDPTKPIYVAIHVDHHRQVVVAVPLPEQLP